MDNDGAEQSVLDGIRPARWWVILLTVVTAIVALTFSNAYLLQDPQPAFVIALRRATSGLINGSLLAAFSTLVATSIVIFGIGRLRCWDVGWRWREFRLGLFVTIAFWIAMQGLLVINAGLTGGLAWHEDWQRRGVGVIAGGILAQFLGTALLEETLMRGFFLPQFFLKVSRVFPRRLSIGLAVVGSTLLFAAFHLPNRLWAGNIRGPELWFDQPALLLFGLLACALYLVTRNLFIAVGLHAIINAPATLVASDDRTVFAVWLGLSLVLVAYWRLSDGKGKVTQVQQPEDSEPRAA